MRPCYCWMILLLCVPFGVHSQHDSRLLLGQERLSFQASLVAPADSVRAEAMESAEHQKSRGKAFLLSLLLPGAGEYYSGDRKMATLFFGTEVVLWSAYVLLNWYGDLKADDYTLYAIAHAGVNPYKKDHEFYVDIEAYDNLIAYNDAMLQERRFDDMYPENELYDWSWDSETSIRQFERMRLKSDRFKNTGALMIGGVVLNHLVSGVNAMRIAKKSSVSAQNRIRLHFAGLPEGGMRVTLWKSF